MSPSLGALKVTKKSCKKETSVKTNIFKKETYNIKKNVYLYNIQRKLSLIFSKYKKHIVIPESFRGHKQLYDSYVNYGFPFVGRHWIPHFTVSSLKVDENHRIIQEFLLDKIDVSFTVKKVSVWNINGNKHQMIDEFILK